MRTKQGAHFCIISPKGYTYSYMNNLENPGQSSPSPEETKKNENKVKLLLEQTIDELSKKEPKTPEVIDEIAGYQRKLADHLNMLDKKYTIAEGDDAFDKAMDNAPDRGTRYGSTL